MLFYEEQAYFFLPILWYLQLKAQVERTYTTRVHSSTGMRKHQLRQSSILSRDKIVPAEHLAVRGLGRMLIWKSSARAYSWNRNSLPPPVGRTWSSDHMEMTGIAWIQTQIEN
jgi:hypothetical protein